jgi:hypothetical protein
VKMTEHFPRARRETLAELSRRVRRMYPLGMGQFARIRLARGVSWHEAARPITRHLQFTGILAMGLLTLGISLATGRDLFFGTWVAAFALVFLAFAIHSGSLKRPAYYFAEWALTAPLMLIGLALPPRAPSDFDDFRAPHRVIAPAPLHGSMLAASSTATTVR